MKASVMIPGGRLTRDVTAVYGEDKALRALFTMAVNSYYKDKDGNKKQGADFIPCIAWGNQAKLMKDYGTKGRQLAIRGTLETYQKEANADGTYPPVKVFVRVSEIEFLGANPNKAETKTETKTETPATVAAPTAEAIAAAMLKQMQGNPAATAEAGIDLSEIV